MKRDNDYLRQLLLEVESKESYSLILPHTKDRDQKRIYHVLLLVDAGMTTEVGRQTFRMTSLGHDFLDAIRDDSIWNRTKGVVDKVGGATLDFVFEIAKACARQFIVEKTGLKF